MGASVSVGTDSKQKPFDLSISVDSDPINLGSPLVRNLGLIVCDRPDFQTENRVYSIGSSLHPTRNHGYEMDRNMKQKIGRILVQNIFLLQFELYLVFPPA